MARSDDRLTPREREVLEGLCSGLACKEIAARLGLSPRTIDVHRTSIYRALGVHCLAQVINRAILRGLYDPWAALNAAEERS